MPGWAAYVPQLLLTANSLPTCSPVFILLSSCYCLHATVCFSEVNSCLSVLLSTLQSDYPPWLFFPANGVCSDAAAKRTAVLCSHISLSPLQPSLLNFLLFLREACPLPTKSTKNSHIKPDTFDTWNNRQIGFHPKDIADLSLRYY